MVVEGRKFQWLIRFALLGCRGGTKATIGKERGQEKQIWNRAYSPRLLPQESMQMIAFW